MSGRLNVPDDLQHLLEKRELADRRSGDRRDETKQPEAGRDAEDQSAHSTTPAVQSEEIEQVEDRRNGDDRRKVVRRAADK